MLTSGIFAPFLFIAACLIAVVGLWPLALFLTPVGFFAALIPLLADPHANPSFLLGLLFTVLELTGLGWWVSMTSIRTIRSHRVAVALSIHGILGAVAVLIGNLLA